MHLQKSYMVQFCHKSDKSYLSIEKILYFPFLCRSDQVELLKPVYNGWPLSVKFNKSQRFTARIQLNLDLKYM